YLHCKRSYREAEALLQQVLTIDEKVYGLNHSEVAIDLNNLASLYIYQGKYEKAESLLQRATTIYKQAFGVGHPDTINNLINLAMLYVGQEKYLQAEP